MRRKCYPCIFMLAGCLLSGLVLAEDSLPELNSPKLTTEPVPPELDTVTTFDTYFLPGIKPCEKNQVASDRLFNNCQDEAILKQISTKPRQESYQQELIVDDLVAPNGNLLRIDIQRKRVLPKPSRTSEN